MILLRDLSKEAWTTNFENENEWPQERYKLENENEWPGKVTFCSALRAARFCFGGV